VGVPAQTGIGQVRASDRDRARGAQAFDQRGVAGRDRLGQRDGTLRGRGAGDVDILLDRDRHAAERPEVIAGGPPGVGVVGGPERLLGEDQP
jgi:hypothetical protein